MTIQGLLDNARTVQQTLAGSMMQEVLQGHEADIIDLQKTQLFMGKGSDGRDLHPFYSEDLKPQGYFRTSRSAANYRAWKQELSYPKSVERNPDAPNLYITGKFHSELTVRYMGDSVAVTTDTAYAANIMRKYGMGVFGLSMDMWRVLFDERGAKDELIEKMKETLWQ